MKLMTLALLAISLQFSSCSYLSKKKCDGDTCKMEKTGEKKEKMSCCSGMKKS